MRFALEISSYLIATIVLSGVSSAADAPYSDPHGRKIKALSAQQLTDIEDGRGMGLALPAELNGYPGPAHAIELAEKLGLTSEQRQKTTELFAAMKEEAQAAGAAYIESEARLDQVFSSGRATPDGVRQLVAQAGERSAAMRFVHLKYHLAMRDLLSPVQIEKYNELRGYDADEPPRNSPGHMHR